ncbi:MAG: chitinase [Myxococcota bacterium]
MQNTSFWLAALGTLLLGACATSSSDSVENGGAAGDGANGGATSAGGTTSKGGSSSNGGATSTAGTSAQGGATQGGANNGGLAEVLSRNQYEEMFPNRNALYDYDSLLLAAAQYPAFATTGSLAERRREVAAMLANFGHETTGGWPTAPGGPEAWGLYFTQEVGCESGGCTQYCDASNREFPCASGKTYHGRGPIQLSWNYNYGQMGRVLGVDLLANPDVVTSNGEVAFKTGIWFWMTPQAPKPSAHDALLGIWVPTAEDTAAGRKPGFGMTINIINGGLECGFPSDDRVKDRVRFFQHFASLLGTTPGDNLECATMQPY